MSKGTLFTIGHSTRTVDEFLDLLNQNGVILVADIRTFPGSRYVPQFNSEAMGEWLREADCDYIHIPSLGGRRPKGLDEASPNKGWTNIGFRNVADHMLTDDFAKGLKKLLTLAAAQPTAIMCSEAVPWRCHRRLVADAALVKGWKVLDIVGNGEPKPHTLTEFASVVAGRLTYPA